MEQEFKDLLGELKTATEALAEADAKRREEIKQYGDATGETKAVVDRIQSRLDEVEHRFERLSLERTDRTGKGETSPKVKAFLNWARGIETKADPEPGMLVFDTEDAAAVLAPPELVTELVEIAYLVDPILQLVRTRRISRGSVLYPTKESRAVAVRDGAAPDFTKRTGEGTYGKGEISVFGAHAVADIEAVSLEDPSIDLAADLQSDWAYSFGQMEAPEILTGDPRVGCGGILRTTPLFVGPERFYSGTTLKPEITYEGLLALVSGLKDAYDANARFLLTRKTLHALRLIEDTEGHLIWQPLMAQGNPGTILGYPYSKSPNMDEVGAGKVPLLFGDFNAAYWLVQRIDVQVQRDPYTQWPHVRFKARKRSGGDLVLPEALKALVTGTAPAG